MTDRCAPAISAEVSISWKLGQGVLLVTIAGDYPFGELKAAIAEALLSPEFQPDTPILFDARSSFKVPSTDALRSLAEWLASLRPQGVSARCAMVTSPERFSLVDRAATRFNDQGFDVAIFTSVAEVRPPARAGGAG